jgi:hypothetical protein
MKPEDFERFLNGFFASISQHLCNCIQKECLIKVKRGEVWMPAFPEFDKWLVSLHTQEESDCNRLNIQLLQSLKNKDYISIEYVLEVLESYGFIKRTERSLFLFRTKKRFTWKNITGLNKVFIRIQMKNNPYLAVLARFFTRKGVSTVSNAAPTVEDTVLAVQCLFWYLRKFVVDKTMANVAEQQATATNSRGLIGISVGSTAIDSDYDITLYGDLKYIGKIIRNFAKEVKYTMKDTSEIVFDTNVYGMSFILFNKRYNWSSVEHRCGGKDFSYLLTDTDVIHSQHVWAFAKLLKSVAQTSPATLSVFDTIDFIDNLSNKDYIALANYVRSELTLLEKSRQDLYPKLIHSYDNFESIVNPGQFLTVPSFGKATPPTPMGTSTTPMSPAPPLNLELVQLLDALRPQRVSVSGKENFSDAAVINTFVSFVNFYGKDTYFTRGAFLDVVVNGQMCDKTGDSKIPLSIHEYLDSFIENMSELLVHPTKSKYLARAISAVINMGRQYSDLIKIYVPQLKRAADPKVILKCISIVWNLYTTKTTATFSKGSIYKQFEIFYRFATPRMKISTSQEMLDMSG